MKHYRCRVEEIEPMSAYLEIKTLHSIQQQQYVFRCESKEKNIYEVQKALRNDIKTQCQKFENEFIAEFSRISGGIAG